MQEASCRDCGAPARRGLVIDGADAILCGDCLFKAISVASRWDYVRRTHRAAHGHEGPGCPVCGDRCVEDLETFLEAARAYA